MCGAVSFLFEKKTVLDIFIALYFVNETRIRIQTAGLAFGGTGLCSCVRGVDGSCAKHLTVEFYMVIYASNSYTC